MKRMVSSNLKVFVWKRYRLIPIICSGWRLNLIPSSPPPWPRPVSRSPTNRRPESREICKEPYRSDQLRFSYSIFQDFAYDLKRFPRIHPQDFGYLNFRADVINNFNGLCFTYKKQSDCLEVTRLVLIDLSAFFSLNLFMVWTVHCKEKTKRQKIVIFTQTLQAWNFDVFGQGDNVLRARTIFALAWFHAVVQERRIFIPQGWCKFYEFSDSDLKAGLQVIELSYTISLSTKRAFKQK